MREKYSVFYLVYFNGSTRSFNTHDLLYSFALVLFWLFYFFGLWYVIHSNIYVKELSSALLLCVPCDTNEERKKTISNNNDMLWVCLLRAPYMYDIVYYMTAEKEIPKQRSTWHTQNSHTNTLTQLRPVTKK